MSICSTVSREVFVNKAKEGDSLKQPREQKSTRSQKVIEVNMATLEKKNC
jgi:hypothetical protein